MIPKSVIRWPIIAGGAITATLLAALLYLLTLSRHYTADSLIYALAIENPSIQSLVDPTHLLLHPVGLLWFRLWQAAGWSGRALVSLQSLNSLAGGICVGLMWLMAQRLSGSFRAATIVALGFAVSGAVWLLSVEAEFVTIPLAFQLAVLCLVLISPTRFWNHSWFAVSLGIVVFVAISGYLTSSFLIIVVLVGYLTADSGRSPKRKHIAEFLATVLLLIIPVYTLISQFLLAGDLRNSSLFNWHGAYGILDWFNLPHGLYAFLRTLGLYSNLAMNDSTSEFLYTADNEQRLIFILYYVLIAILTLLPLVCLVRNRRQLWLHSKRQLLVILSWTIPFLLFAFFWVPGDITFWAPLLSAWWLLCALCFSLGCSKRGESLALIAILALGIINASQVIIPRTNLASNDAYQAAMRVAAGTEEEDLLLARTSHLTLLTIRYFAQRNILPAPASTINRHNPPEWIAAEMEKARIEGGRLLLVDENGVFRELD